MANKDGTGRRTYRDGALFWRKSRGLWVARIELEVTDGPDGTPRRRRMEKSFRHQSDALTWLSDRKRDIAAYGRAADPSITVEAWSKRWLADICTPRLARRSLVIYEYDLKNWILPKIGRKKLSSLTVADVRAVTAAMRQQGRALSSMHRTHAVVSAMLEDARRDGILTENVAKRMRLPAVPKRERPHLTASQVRTILQRADARFATQILTGMRKSEVLGLTWQCVDLPGRDITVAWQLQEMRREHGCGPRDGDRWPCGKRNGAACSNPLLPMPDGRDYRIVDATRVLVPPKGRKTRTVPIIDLLAAILQRHADATDGQPNPHDLVFHHPDGRPLDHEEDGDAWRALMRASGLPETWGTHATRHGVATLLLEAGVDARVVAEVVGHANVNLTRGTYQHVSSELARAGMAKFGELVTGG